MALVVAVCSSGRREDPKVDLGEGSWLRATVCWEMPISGR